MEWLIQLAERLGIGAVILIGAYKIIQNQLPKILAVWHDAQKAKETQSAEQFNIVIKLAEQSNAVIGQATAVIERNNVIIGQIAESNSAMLDALIGNTEAMDKFREQMIWHDQRAEGMNNNICRLIGMASVNAGGFEDGKE